MAGRSRGVRRMRDWAAAGLLLALSANAAAMDVPERRRDQFGRDFSYFVYPIAADIPGLGKAAGAGASVLNIGQTDADFTGFYIDGDFKASGYALLDLHVLPHRLVVDAGYFDFKVAPIEHSRGIGSDHNDYILPTAVGYYGVAQVTGTFWERRVEAYYRGLRGMQRLTQVRDKNGNAFATFDSDNHAVSMDTVGGTLDFTDDRLDPRRGVRAEAALKIPYVSAPNYSRFVVADYNLTGYVPMRRHDTFAVNLYESDAIVTKKGPTDYATLQQRMGLNCGSIPAGPQQDSCFATEKKFIDERIAFNEHGDASSLGGTQRLRSYDNGRFHAGHAVTWGAEYRWNLTDERTPFDIFIAKGIRTGLQLAFFAEQGTVYDQESQRWEHLKASYGLGFRIVLSGIVIRADAAQGSEGGNFILFITYPWSMFSVDHPS